MSNCTLTPSERKLAMVLGDYFFRPNGVQPEEAIIMLRNIADDMVKALAEYKQGSHNHAID